MKKKIAILMLAGLFGAVADAAEPFDSLHYRVELQASLSGGDHTPLWLNANKYGLSSLEKVNGYVRAGVARPLTADDGKKWGLGYGLDVALAHHYTSTLVVQQAYAEGRWLKTTLTVGSKEYPMELKNNALSSGSQALGINARPIPQVRFALPDYWTVPYTKNWLAVKGHLAYGKPTDDNWQKDFTHRQSKYTENTWHHSKAGYLRIGPKNITLEMGLEMACQFGGTVYLEDEIIHNKSGLGSFFQAIFPSGGDATDGDNYQNASGNHLGSWVARLNFDNEKWNLGIYADHFFEDNSAMFQLGNDGYGSGENWNKMEKFRFFGYDFKDILLGLELKLKCNPWLNDVVLEYLYTKYQSGPVYHDHTPQISTQISGRDQFYNHNLYTGWQHWGMVMGNPLYLSPLYNDNSIIRVLNNRFVAWHFGASGSPLPQLAYRLLATWQRGYGTIDDLFYDPRENVSLMAEVGYLFAKGWSVKAAVGADFGKLYGDNTGCQLTIVKSGLLNLKRK